MLIGDSQQLPEGISRATPNDEETSSGPCDGKLQKSLSLGDLSGVSESTEPTASFSDTDSIDEHRPTVSQIDLYFQTELRERNKSPRSEEKVIKLVNNQREEDSSVLEEDYEDDVHDDDDENDDILSHMPTVPQLGDENDTIFESGSQQDRLLPDGIPMEVTVFHHSAVSFVHGSSVNGETDQRRIQLYETLLLSYKEKLESSERLNDSSYEYLREAQGYAEELLSQRQELVSVIEQMENDENRRSDQELLLKGITCSSLLFYLAGGSHLYLVAAVVLQLFIAVVNLVL